MAKSGNCKKNSRFSNKCLGVIDLHIESLDETTPLVKKEQDIETYVSMNLFWIPPDFVWIRENREDNYTHFRSGAKWTSFLIT